MLDRLLAGEPVRFPPGTVDEAEVRATAEAFWGRVLGQEPGDGPPQPRVEATVASVQKHGLGMRLRLDTPRSSLLMLELGRQAGTALCHFSDEELGLPNTRGNPYRLLSNNLRAPTPPRAASAALQRPLPGDVVLPPDRLWHSALREFGRMSGLDLISDGYLARARSRLWSAGPGEVLVRRGTPLAEALDALCEPFQYLWWEKDGVVHFRSRAWVWDMTPEPPDRFVDAWSAAVERKTAGATQLAALAELTPRQWNGLADLGWNSHLPPKYREAVQEFLALFAASTPAQRAQLLGSGLAFTPGETETWRWLFLQVHAPKGEGPVRLHMEAAFAPSARNPGTVHVTLSLVRRWANSTSAMAFGFDMPRLSDPFPSTPE
jgi:hypothetical protein